MGDYRGSNGSVTSHDSRVLSVVPSREGDVRVVFQKVDGDASDDDEHFTDILHPSSHTQNNDRDADDTEMATGSCNVNSSSPKRGHPLLCCGKDDVEYAGDSGNSDRKGTAACLMFALLNPRTARVRRLKSSLSILTASL